MTRYLMTVAGFDPTGGAGIVRDSIVFFNQGFKPLCIPTAWTLQDGERVLDVSPLPEKYIQKNLSLMLNKKPIGIKIGMVGKESIIKILFNTLKDFDGIIVFDPVINASGGESLYDGDIQSFSILFSISHVITPNREEGELLTSFKKPEDIVKELKKKTKGAVVLTGSGDYDLIYDGERMVRIEGRRLERTIHGSGCRFSSYILSFLANGISLEEAVKRARKKIEEEIKAFNG